MGEHIEDITKVTEEEKEEKEASAMVVNHCEEVAVATSNTAAVSIIEQVNEVSSTSEEMSLSERTYPSI